VSRELLLLLLRFLLVLLLFPLLYPFQAARTTATPSPRLTFGGGGGERGPATLGLVQPSSRRRRRRLRGLISGRKGPRQEVVLPDPSPTNPRTARPA